ncbi:MAG TPA: hypothetical protein VGO10_18240 [Baekduia sp.]|nr:hypothetical protein [Baekduia sp.]
MSEYAAMSHNDIDSFFREYVFGFMIADVRREIDRAAAGESAGNFLCALGLLCYTEVLGGVRRGTLAQGESRANFDSFFRELGAPYASLLDEGHNVYKLLRCGMAHEYLIKGVATISMLKGVEPAGVAVAPEGRWYFAVERYFEAFEVAARRMHSDLMADAGAELPSELRH